MDASAFVFCPRCGSEASGGRARRFTCPKCDFEYFFNVAAAVAAFIFDEQSRVLLIRRQREPGRGLLAPPGGFVDPGETAEAALRREVREEVGLALDHVALLTAQPNRYAAAGLEYEVLDLFFLAPMSTLAAARALEEVQEVVIRPRQSIDPDELAFPSMRAAWRCWMAR